MKTDAPGYPDRSPDLDALPGFKNPPLGYGEAPFWWWTGDDLDVDRLLEQLRKLNDKGISGVQVNYSHTDTPGWPTDSAEPAIFSDAWWKVYSRVSEECEKHNMGIGLSTYTLDWPNGADNLFHRLFYSKSELNAIELVAGEPIRVRGDEDIPLARPDGCFAVRAYEVKDGQLQPGGIDLSSSIPHSALRTPHSAFRIPHSGDWEVWTFSAVPRKGTLNPLMEGAGQTIIDGFFQPFEDHNPGEGSKGLNYFFNDELNVGLEKFAWNRDFADEFKKRKGYDLLDVLPAMWVDMGDITPKVRIDYADVRMSLMEERYFEPIYNWHASRGIIFGCDNHGRGLQPDAYGDYFRATRWYTAPGHDTPGGKADLLKGKVSSSIANLYGLPRVQLEGYHSLGWGATTERIMEATCQNYLYGCNLLSFHGCYYTTHGSHWEWAPPCYHWRMPYWDHMGTFLKYFERLSYLMSQGHHVCDVAVIYPVTPFEAELGAESACKTAFELAMKLMGAGINFDFIDHQSLERAVVQGDRLVIPKNAERGMRNAEHGAEQSGLSYRALVFPNMEAVRWTSIDKASLFASAGGHVLVVGALPSASDRAGRNDVQMAAMNDRTFGPGSRLATAEAAVERIRNAFVPDVRGLHGTVIPQHRKIGQRDVYMVMGANPGDVVEFRAKGSPELWDPWTGDSCPLNVVGETETGTQVELPLEKYEAQIVVFEQEPGVRSQESVKPEPRTREQASVLDLSENEWHVSFEPTMDNRHGDFRLPVTPENEVIGVEARRFAWARETDELAATAMLPGIDDSEWRTQLHGYGPQFYLLGSLPKTADTAALDSQLAALDSIAPDARVAIDGESHHWSIYDFSWRYGKEGDPGHQGFHGLKETISDNFIRVGTGLTKTSTGITHEPDDDGRYYLWTSILLEEGADIELHVSQPAPAGQNAGPVNAPAAVFIDGDRIDDLTQTLHLNAGRHALLLRYEDGGESHVVLRRANVPIPAREIPLAMSWYDDPGLIPFDPFAGDSPAEWFRFLSAPGTTAISLRAESSEPVRAWIDGKPMTDKGNGHFEVPDRMDEAATVAIRLVPHPGQTGGAAIPEPIVVETDDNGVMAPGDWSKQGILNNYSGGVRYRTTFTLTEEEAEAQVELDLGRVTATAEVTVNGKPAGIRVAPPWKLDLSRLLHAGENELEVLVYNTLSNHYQTIPSMYRGDPESGLLGPVKLLGLCREETV